MRRELAAVYDELVRRQMEGEKSVFLSEDALRLLRLAVAELPAQHGAAASPRKAAAVAAASVSADVVEPKPARVTPPPKIEVPPPPEFVLPQGDKRTRWEALRERVMDDPWCRSQVKPGKRIVLGVGSLDARIFFCGEAPGADEEVQGEPFVGAAGQLLTRVIQAMGLQRADVYIGNIMNYRPPLPSPVGNRPPEREEMAYCLPYLLAQLEIVQPEVIVALGATAMDGLLGHDPKRKISRVRGHWMEFNGIPLIPTFHPSYLLRNQSLATKRQVWEDMLAVMDKLAMPVSERQRAFFLK